MEQDNRTKKYQQMHQLLNEKQFLALEAKERGNIVLVAREAGVSKNTVTGHKVWLFPRDAQRDDRKQAERGEIGSEK